MSEENILMADTEVPAKPTEVVKRKRGRPVGSKNKPKVNEA